MMKVQKKFLKRKLALLLILLILLFSLFKVSTSFASVNSFTISNAEISEKSSAVEIKNFNYENCNLQSNVIFHNVGDIVTYKINVRNNDNANYTVVSISDDNESNYISYEYGACEGLKLNSNDEVAFYITEKYTTENLDMSNRTQQSTVNILITLVDESGDIKEETISINNSSSPKTGDDVGIYVTTAIVSAILLLVVSRKKTSNSSAKHSKHRMKMFSVIIVGALIVPSMSKALTTKEISLSFENKVVLHDKLLVLYIVDDEEHEITVNYNEKIGALETPEKEGYAFVGWETPNGEILDANTPITKDTVVKAKFNLIDYNIHYNLNGGTVDPENPTTYTIEDEITLVNPTRLGYTFSGWTGSNCDELQTRVTINQGSIGDKTYTANYSPNPDTRYTVIHKLMNLDGETYTIRDTEILHGATDTEVQPQTNVYPGFKAPDEQLITIGADGNTVLEYAYKREQYALTLINPNDIEVTPSANKYYYEQTITLKAKDKTGYTFNRWNTYETTKQISKTITGPLTMEAIYDINSYTISFDSKGGSSVADITRNYNEEIGTLPVPTKNRQVFVGWYEDEEYTTPIDSTTKVTATKTYYAKWRDLNNFVIQFNSNGGNEIASITVEEGSALGTLQVPEKENYKFRGWYTDNNYTTKVDENTIPTQSTTYYAKWVDRLATVFSIENSVTFKGQNTPIADGEVPAEYLGTDGKYVDSHVALFSNTNYDKDFELGFTIVSYDPDAQDAASKPQFVFVNTKDEDGSTSVRPGFAFRVYERSAQQFQFVASTNSSSSVIFNDYSTVHTVKIFRENKKIYYSIDNGEKKLLNVNYANYTERFNTTATFGASVQRNETVYRHINATLSNMYIKLEVDDEY